MNRRATFYISSFIKQPSQTTHTELFGAKQIDVSAGKSEITMVCYVKVEPFVKCIMVEKYMKLGKNGLWDISS
jgi:hypothetical protein